MNKLKQSAFFISTFIFFGYAEGQESVNSSGGDANGSGGTVAYSVGEIIYTYESDNAGNITQGVQQTYEITDVSTSETELNMALRAFPNPTSDYLNLKIEDYNKEGLTYQLFDFKGKKLKDGIISGEETKIEMKLLPSATYFINILNQDKQKLKSFKIIKQ